MAAGSFDLIRPTPIGQVRPDASTPTLTKWVGRTNRNRLPVHDESEEFSHRLMVALAVDLDNRRGSCAQDSPNAA